MTNWAPNIEHFKRDYRVIALDLPGHGKSSYLDSDYRLDLFSNVIRGLLSNLTIDRVTMIGNSLGGMITIHVTLSHPYLVGSLVLVDSAGGHGFPGLLKRIVKRMPQSWLKRFILFATSRLVRFKPFYRLAGIYRVNEYTKVLLDEARATVDRPDLDTYLETYARCARTALNVTYKDRLDEICKPALIVWGQKDLALSLNIGQRINKKIKGSFLVPIPDAAHVPQLDQPEIFNSAVDRFLSGVMEG